MALLKKINPSSKVNPDTGFGVQADQIGGRFVNKDGTFNLRKVGYPLFKRLSVYSWFLEISWAKFLGIIVLFYLSVNIAFTLLYVLAGIHQLQGLLETTRRGQIFEVYFFSTETFTTVGYGRINPVGGAAHLIASFESMLGFVCFALVTGLMYGRFTRPKAYLAFSDFALISPYRGITALMFRMVPYKSHHHLTDAKTVVNVGFRVMENDNPVYKFYQLKLELNRIDTFNMNWTVVHPIDEESPLLSFTPDDIEWSDLELYIQVSGFDPIFSNMVLQRTSYTYKEIIWGARFKPMYHESADGTSTILELNKLNDYEKVTLPGNYK